VNSGEFSSHPMQPDERPCPVCGVMVPTAADMCWLCLQKTIRDELPPPNVRRRQPEAEDLIWVFVSCALLVAMVLLLCAVLAYEAPGIFLVLLPFGAFIVARILTQSDGQRATDAVPSHPVDNPPTYTEPGTKLIPKVQTKPSRFLVIVMWIVIVISMGASAVVAVFVGMFVLCTASLVAGRDLFPKFDSILIFCWFGATGIFLSGAAWYLGTRHKKPN